MILASIVVSSIVWSYGKVDGWRYLLLYGIAWVDIVAGSLLHTNAPPM